MKSKIINGLVTALLILSMANVHGTTVIDLPKWQNIQLPNNPSLRGSAVIHNALWVSGSHNTVFVSQDAGKTWQDKSVKSDLKTDFRDIALFDKDTAIVMGVGSGKESTLFKTIDGGNTWKTLYQNNDEAGFFDSIAFWDKENGLLMGDPVDGYYAIMKTSDGGKTWRRIKLNKLPEILDKEAAFAASGNTLIVGDNGVAWITTGGFSASAYESTDFGETWKRHKIPLYSETQTAGGYGIALNHQNQVFIVGGDYEQRSAIYQNMVTRKGERWELVDTGKHGLRTAMRCEGIICISTGKTSNDISFNGGVTWRVLANAKALQNEQGFYTLASSNKLFLAAGANGKVGIYSFRVK